MTVNSLLRLYLLELDPGKWTDELNNSTEIKTRYKSIYEYLL